MILNNPLFIEPGKEEDEMVDAIYSRLESEAYDLNQTPFKTTIHGQETEIHYDMDITQCDNKIFKKLTGTNGAFCKQCHISQEDSSKLENIAQGFQITRSIEETKEKYTELLNHPRFLKTGEFSKIPSKDRKGVTHWPMGQGKHFNFHLRASRNFLMTSPKNE